MNASTLDQQTVRQQRATARRQQILEAAVRLFARQGVARTTTRQIAHEVGVTEGLIFKYYPSKLALVRAVTGSPHVLLADLREILKNTEARPLAEVMAEVATTWLERLHCVADLSTILFGEALINQDIGDVLDELIREGSAELVGFLDARQQAGQITAAVDTRTIAHLYMASILMFFLRYRRLSERKWKSEAAASRSSSERPGCA